MAYAGNSLITIAVALLYRYADFVTLLGGTEFHLGWIVGVGMIGSLLMRFALGSGIDRYGPRRVWLGSLVLFSLVCFAHLSITTCHGPAIYLLRIALYSSIAGIFGASITFISGRVPMARMAELVGMLGTSGFMGMVVGSMLGDLLCSTQTVGRPQMNQLFVLSGALSLVAIVFAWLATRGSSQTRRRRRAPIVALVRRYQPGTVLLVGIAVGAALALPAIFLRTFAAELGIARIGLFFAIYSPTAIVTRVATRHAAERIGLVPMTLIGLAVLSAGNLLFLSVEAEWQFLFPAIAYGISHAILFPTITASGTGTFPIRYRGLGTMVILAAFDTGQLFGAPLAGAILHGSGLIGLPRYPTLFVAMACLLGIVGAGYALTTRHGDGPPNRTHRPEPVKRRRKKRRVLAASG